MKLAHDASLFVALVVASTALLACSSGSGGAAGAPDAGPVACTADNGTCKTSIECCSDSCSIGGVCNAPSRCAALGAACAKGVDCCTGTCVGGSCAAPTCVDDLEPCLLPSDCCSTMCDGSSGTCKAPDPACTELTKTCATDADCCSGHCGLNHACGTVACSKAGQACQASADCCGGYFCASSACTAQLAAGSPCTTSDMCKSGLACDPQSGACKPSGACGSLLGKDLSGWSASAAATPEELDLNACACDAGGPCATVCVGAAQPDFCEGQAPAVGGACDLCLHATGLAGCGDQLRACQSN